MTTEEFEKKLKISKDTWIHCPTLELAKQVLSIFHQLGLKWCRENTIYYPFEGEFSSLEFTHAIGYKIISAEEFIALHTEGEKFNLENYEPKGELEGFPKEIISRMIECQEEQGNPRDISIFEKQIEAGMDIKGFFWDDTKEKFEFWKQVIRDKDFNLFFEKYPKKGNHDNPQDFRVGDKVIDIILDLKGEITNVKSNGNLEIQFEGESCLIELSKIAKRPPLLHYRDDYDYDVIDFNNLPKRQESKRWRAEKGRLYYFVNFFTNDWFFSDETNDDYDHFDNDNYNSGNYFSTEVEAEIIAQKLNSYMKQLIQEEHEHKRN